MGVLCPPGFVPSPLLVQLMLTHDQQQPMAADSSQNSYEQYIQNYAAQQAYAQQAYAVYEASFTRNRTYVPREPKKCVRSDGPSKCPYHGRAPPYGDPFAGNKMLPGETEAMWKKWYEAQGYDTTNWWGCCPGSEGPSPPLPDKPPTDPQVKQRSLFSASLPPGSRPPVHLLPGQGEKRGEGGAEGHHPGGEGGANVCFGGNSSCLERGRGESNEGGHDGEKSGETETGFCLPASPPASATSWRTRVIF